MMGRAWKLGDGVSTDTIMPGRYNLTTDAQALARACLCEARPDFAEQVRTGDVIVAGRNFGCGSSREHAPLSIRASGVAAVVAVSFSRIFARNAVNIGLPVIRCPEAATVIADGDEVTVDVERGLVHAGGRSFEGEAPSALAVRIARAGSLVELIRTEGWAAVEEVTA
jgi:3-isopropylmalate dehydratase small subunit